MRGGLEAEGRAAHLDALHVEADLDGEVAAHLDEVRLQVARLDLGKVLVGLLQSMSEGGAPWRRVGRLEALDLRVSTRARVQVGECGTINEVPTADCATSLQIDPLDRTAGAHCPLACTTSSQPSKQPTKSPDTPRKAARRVCYRRVSGCAVCKRGSNML